MSDMLYWQIVTFIACFVLMGLGSTAVGYLVRILRRRLRATRAVAVPPGRGPYRSISLADDEIAISFINNCGGGFAGPITIKRGTTVGELYAAQIRNSTPENYFIRVNRTPANLDQVLESMDRVSITPTKIEGR
jgi:hypothetical protein